MTETHVLSALKAKRSEIMGHIGALEEQANTWRARLAHIDGAILIFSPETDPSAIPTKKRYVQTGYFKGGELARGVSDALRKAGEPISARDVAKTILAAKGLPQDDTHLTHRIRARVINVLRRKAREGSAVRVGNFKAARWALVSGP